MNLALSLRNVFIFVLLIFFMSSCDISKRRYIHGYYVNKEHSKTETSFSNDKKKKQKDELSFIKSSPEQVTHQLEYTESIETESYVVISETLDEESKVVTENLDFSIATVGDSPSVVYGDEIKFPETAGIDDNEKEQSLENKGRTSSDGRTFDIYALLSFIFSVTGLILGGITIGGSLAGVLSAIGGLLLLGGLVLGIIGIIRIKRSGGELKGMWAAIIGLVIPALILIISVIAIIGFLNFFGEVFGG